MERVWQVSGKCLAGLLFAASYATPQAYTISAKSGAVNYVEGIVSLNGNRLSDQAVRATFLGVNDTLSTEDGRAEVLLSPGVFLRIGDNSQIRMVVSSLVNSQVEVMRGEVMLEVAGLQKDNTVQINDHGGSVNIDKNGLYRIIADDPPRVEVLDGKAAVSFGSRTANLGKGKQVVLSEALKTEKFDTKKADDLYAWSNIRSEYNAAASYQAANSIRANSFGAWGGYGFSGWSTPGWYWASGFNSWAWLPGSGAFYSPFGYGFYSPGTVAYAPVVISPVYTGGNFHHRTGERDNAGNPTLHRGPWNGHWAGRPGINAAVPVNPDHPAAVGTMSSSPWANRAARARAAQTFTAADSGFSAANGAAGFGNRGISPGNNAAVSGSTATRSGWSGNGHHAWSGANGASNAGAWSGGNRANGGAGWSGRGGAGGGGGWSGGNRGGGGGGGWSGGGGHAGAAASGGGHAGGTPGASRGGSK